MYVPPGVDLYKQEAHMPRLTVGKVGQQFRTPERNLPAPLTLPSCAHHDDLLSPSFSLNRRLTAKLQ